MIRPPVTTFASHRRGAVGLLVLLVVCAARSAAAQAPVPAAQTPAPQLNAPSISLADAVQLTVAHDPQIKLGEQSIAISTGSLQQAKGRFDWTLLAKPSFTYSNTALQPGVRQDEANRRLKLQTVATAFGDVNRTLLDQIANIGREVARPPRCPLEFPSLDQISQGVDPLAIRFPGVPGIENAFFTFSGGLRSTIQLLKDKGVCGTAEQAVSNSGALLSTLPASIIARLQVLQEPVITLTQTPVEVLSVGQQIAQAASSSAVLALDRLGVVPLDEIVTTGVLDTSLNRVFRSGTTAGFAGHFQSRADNFKDKSIDASFGGNGKPIMFNASVSGTLNIPLERGRGIAARAPETAARLTLSAQSDRLRHTASEEAFRTVLAYLNLVGAQESVRSLEESADRQSRVIDLTQRLVTAGDLAAVEVSRVRARSAAVATSLSQARSNVVNARVSLAEAMGVDVGMLANAPLAADSFLTTVKPVPETEAMVTTALGARFDARAVVSLRNAAEALEAGAYANARPRIDFALKVGMSTFYEDLPFYYLPDEANPVFTLLPQPAPAQTTTGAVTFNSPVGYGRAMFQQTWKPLWSTNFVLDLPWHNGSLLGRAAQAEAARRRAAVQERDLRRVIRENIVNETESLRQQAAGIERATAALTASQQSMDAVLARYQQQDQTLFDTLLTEESLTQDRLTLVRLWQEYLSELARLRFETGSLLTFSGTAVAPDKIAFDPTEFVRR